MYTIYINETVLIITDTKIKTKSKAKQIDHEGFVFPAFYKSVKTGKQSGIFVIKVKNAGQYFKTLKESVRVIKAAGGLVKNEDDKYLFIFRKGVWDLPKGKIDEGEKTKKAAVREVEEECGIHVDEVGQKLCKTWHVYEISKQIVLKKTTWYAMKALNQPNLVPQLEEDITDARWLGKDDFAMVEKNTYPLISGLIGLLKEKV
ncbi:NUDIX domain-containing protein [Pedobacter sp. HMF7647]|uniref:NUDIX domain-containing protein n=1 Tax=Hufsiella arboris TaxID=2695275 RepID=A0A7K1Y7R0_9SPHI|nr:NUDIX domain-containing protein [Hufsiella arboris]MXV50613.1 NUDIX domain-containing protein [Hufsiella arboris]